MTSGAITITGGPVRASRDRAQQVGDPRLGAGAGEGRGALGARDAVRRALRGLEGHPPALVLTFAGGALAADDVAEQAARAAGDACVVGMTGASAIGAGGPVDDGCVALALDGATDVGTGVVQRASSDLRAAARTATADALAGLAGRPATLLMLFVDTASGDQGAAAAGAYDAAGPHVPLVGGGAGGDDPAQLIGGRALRDAVVAVALATPRPAGVGIAHGCRPRPGPSIATSVEGAVVRRLDGYPAEQVYMERLGLAGTRMDDATFERLAAVHPLGQLELRGDVRLRHVLGRTPEGGLRCATRVPPNAPIQFAEQTATTIIASARTAAEQAAEQLGARPWAALVFDCGGRRHALGGAGAALRAEVDALTAAFGAQPPALAGLYTRGEIGRVRGARGDRNHAVVVAALA
ncbi:MAG: FIST C-terminal domain-containing protein [Solirubrobacteraceae bacterium MAG38_C4-C5]|nr:FIST C-terminal domain-containing protein [Candidatus Siliceabacter maunaloa]